MTAPAQHEPTRRGKRPSRRTSTREALAEFGWTVVSEKIVGEITRSSGLRWAVASVHTGASEMTSVDLGVDVARFIVTLSGTADIALGSEEFALPPGNALIVLGDQPLRVVSSAEWTRHEWRIAAVPSGLIRARVIRPVPLRVTPAILRLIDSMTRSLLIEAPSADSHAQEFLYRLLSQTVVTAIADELRFGSKTQTLFERAQLIIEAEYVKPEFTVAALCRSLSVSRSYLYEIYARYGTTPRREIDRQRIGSVAARRDLDVGIRASEVTGVAGFSSVQARRTALSRFKDDDPDAVDAWGR